MQAASREALATLRKNQVVVDSASLSVAQVTAQVDEIYAAAGLLTAQPQLRRAIGDAAAAPKARTDLVQAVFGRQVTAPVLALTQAAATERWSDPWDLVDSLETVGDEMSFAVAEKQGVLDEVEDELFRFERILDSEGRLSTLLDDPNASTERRMGLLDTVVAGKVHPLTMSLLGHAVQSRNKRTIGTSVRSLLDAAGALRARSVARVLSAIELTGAQQQRLAAALSELYGRSITVLTAVDAGVRGGLVVRVGDEIIDGSVAARLASVRNALAS
jgi:F-type H+-transporting ATPase subunit delta